MTDHPQTATERFLRHGVAGGFVPTSGFGSAVKWDFTSFDDVVCFTCETGGFSATIESLMLNPALWEAAGRSLGWGMTDNPMCKWLNEWEFHWHGLLEWLAAHPGDVEGYLSQIIGGSKENV